MSPKLVASPPATEGAIRVHLDEASLIVLLRARDAAAYEIFVREYGGQLLAIARRYLRCEEDCTDAVQEAFISAFRAIDRFEGNSSLATWLHRILVNACLMKLRASSRKSEISIESLLPSFDKSGHHAQPVRDWTQRPEERLMREEMRGLIRRSIDALPEDYRTILLLRDIDQLSTEEAAETLGTAPGTVRTRLHRARQALRSLLDPHFASRP
jgi:RNA polymerase sigma-70 factor (ECF subfamily)